MEHDPHDLERNHAVAEEVVKVMGAHLWFLARREGLCKQCLIQAVACELMAKVIRTFIMTDLEENGDGGYAEDHVTQLMIDLCEDVVNYACDKAVEQVRAHMGRDPAKKSGSEDQLLH